jgi:hypothetical protein
MQNFNLLAKGSLHVEMRKVFVVTAISLGIVGLSFLIPAVIVPIYERIANSGPCSDFGCAQNAYKKCEGQWGANTTGTFEILKKGVDGMVCMWYHKP